MAEAKLTIGHIARAAGVNVETVRYYQRRGLVSLPPKRARAVEKLALIQSKLVDVARLRDVLRGLAAACDQPHGAICPIIEQLEAES
jgi:MerR family mercuric resistance operon transcriptional regulator